MHRSPYETWAEIEHMDEFTVLPEHIAILRRAHITWVGDEWSGAPGMNHKRPLGNSDHYDDLAEIVDGRTDNQHHSSDKARYDRLFAECTLALQIVLETGSFQPGRYVLRGLPARWHFVE
ncbi:hypothetical protein HNP84_000344 [Thermocatellispora tengchongensis]|uniref:Uncharacterized protein n=1 Tax=Thermocatellispora tengchongensis TaxID=1073253 RepID=A0A840NWT7_9ACTN|nr:hypothetical protein [Thermocatellispora tengchongensis]MBB5130656.1 hypothetical protein [Thermocatellispora tengchongensis]